MNHPLVGQDNNVTLPSDSDKCAWSQQEWRRAGEIAPSFRQSSLGKSPSTNVTLSQHSGAHIAHQLPEIHHEQNSSTLRNKIRDQRTACWAQILRRTDLPSSLDTDFLCLPKLHGIRLSGNHLLLGGFAHLPQFPGVERPTEPSPSTLTGLNSQSQSTPN